MPRSYLYIPEGNKELLFQSEVFEADALVIALQDASSIFKNFEKYEEIFKTLKSNNKEIYLRLTFDKKESYRLIKDIKGEYLTGWVIPCPTPSLLNSLVMKVRDFESKQKLDFGSLNFILEINEPKAVVNFQKLASYERVKAFLIDEEGFMNKTAWANHDGDFLYRNLAIYSKIYEKELIEKSNLDLCLKYDVYSLACSGIEDVKIANEFFTPKSEEIEEAWTILSTASEKRTKEFNPDYQEISDLQISRSKKLLARAKRLGLSNVDQKETKKVEEAFPKKFYTIGEEIGNAITHGLGIILSIIYIILLGLKSNSKIELFSYLVFGFSSLSLYLCSTLYHGLPLGGAAKRLFQKFDHMTIYFLIAGTYTPLMILGVGGAISKITILLWIGALIGVFLNLFWFGRFRVFHMLLYLGLGWIAIFYLDIIFDSLGSLGTILIIAGGITYTIGILFYGLKLFKFTHMVWHIFVLLGTLLHFLAIYLAL